MPEGISRYFSHKLSVGLGLVQGLKSGVGGILAMYLYYRPCQGFIHYLCLLPPMPTLPFRLGPVPTPHSAHGRRTAPGTQQQYRRHWLQLLSGFRYHSYSGNLSLAYICCIRCCCEARFPRSVERVWKRGETQKLGFSSWRFQLFCASRHSLLTEPL